ncbi:hypothetical protein FGG78_01755 [Thioclava sp. BHET1]|nr:hypothetical protein FGG78_01755 [Thioclava sp. BHET1]
MFGFVRLAIFGFIGLSVIFVLVRIYARSLRREALEDAWAEARSGAALYQTQEAYVAEGMRAYDKSLRRKLIWLVYVVPTVLVVAVIYLMNYT